MGYTTDFVGSLLVEPPLNDEERLFFGALARSTNPSGTSLDDAVAGMSGLPGRSPNAWCPWEVCSEGCCLCWDGHEKPYGLVPWLHYLMATFLVPGGAAQEHPGFGAFTFDHVVNGMLVGCRRDNRELYSITVRDNDAEIELLWPGNPKWSTYPPLAHQVQIDRWREWLCEEQLSASRTRAEERWRERIGDIP